MSEYAFEGAKQGSAAILWSFAGQTFAQDATRPISSAIPVAFQSTIADAFSRWSSVSGLVFSQVVDAATVPIRIGFGAFDNPAELGETDFFYSRGIINPDALIRLLDPASSPLSPSPTLGYVYSRYNVTLFQVAVHEIGHALGLDHTTDPATIMFPYASPTNRDLAAGDIQGINTLYPLFTVAAANPVQPEGGAGQTNRFDFTVTRYGDPAGALTINYAVSGTASALVAGSVAAPASAFVGGGYPTGQLTFQPGSTTATVSILTAGNATPQADYGFALSLGTGVPTDSVTVRGAVQGVILDDDGTMPVSARSVGVFRFFDRIDGTHFYSASQSERNTLILNRPDLVYEGIGLTAVASSVGEQAAVPVFRFFDTGNGTHFYTASATERDSLIATRHDLTLEGTAFYEHAAPQAGDSAVFRFFDTSNGTHFYTANAGERASILATRSDLRDEGVAFYAPSA